jgi:hypothetical protein
MSAAAARILRDAAAELETNGWTQGAIHDGERSCLVGALRRAVGLPNTEVETTPEVYARFRLAFDPVELHLGEAPARWNDQPDRTQAEVIKELLTVADLEEVQ